VLCCDVVLYQNERADLFSFDMQRRLDARPAYNHESHVRIESMSCSPIGNDYDHDSTHSFNDTPHVFLTITLYAFVPLQCFLI
jgi:hypothetical protein